MKHKPLSFSLCILPTQSTLSHDYAPMMHTALHYLHSLKHIPLLFKTPTFSAIPVLLLSLSVLLIMKMISDPYHQVSNLMADFFPSLSSNTDI